MFLEEWLQPYRWYHVCVTNDPGASQKVSIYLNGNLLARHGLKLNVLAKGYFAFVGFFDPDFYPGLSVVANLTQFNVWQSVLSLASIESMATCDQDLQGDLVAWDSNLQQFGTQNVIFHSVHHSSLCRSEDRVGTHLLPSADFYESSYLCEGIGGKLMTPRTLDEGQKLVSWARETTPQCKLYWIGIWDELQGGEWIYHKTSEQVWYRKCTVDLNIKLHICNNR